MLPLVLVLVAASLTLAGAVATSATLELAMAAQVGERLRAIEAADAGILAVLRAGEWSPAAPWSSAGTLPAGGAWQAEVRLTAARIDPLSGEVEWLFEIESTGRAGVADAVLREDFAVTGALPGTPRRRGWRIVEPAP